MRSERGGLVRRLTTGVALAAMLAGAAACELEQVAIPRTEAALALHGVLSASAPAQLVLLERTRNGSVQILAPPFDLYPIVDDEGIAELGASMTLETPGGELLVAREEVTVRGDGTGRGVYRFTLPGSALVRGATYRLTVTSRQGEVLRASATVPGGEPATQATARTLDRARDTLVLEWPAVAGARSYQVRVETPFGPRAFFVEGTRVRLPGLLRNPDARALQRVFVPGFQQAVTVTAVDSNYYDWYRTSNNLFTGRGIVERVEGGIGMFGGVVRLVFDDVRVTAPQPEPAAGRWEYAGTDEQRATTPYLAFDVWVESPATRGDQADALSGRYHVRPRLGYVGCLTCGLLGTVRGEQVRLALLRDWSGADTVEILEARLRGDTLVGKYRNVGDSVVFVRRGRAP